MIAFSSYGAFVHSWVGHLNISKVYLFFSLKVSEHSKLKSAELKRKVLIHPSCLDLANVARAGQYFLTFRGQEVQERSFLVPPALDAIGRVVHRDRESVSTSGDTVFSDTRH